MEKASFRVLRAEKLQFLVLLWGTFDAGSGDAVAHWDLADDELYTFGGSGFRVS